MRNFVDVLSFELRLHLSAPLFWCFALLFLALNVVTQTRTGINLGENDNIALNSGWLIFQTQVVLGLFAMLASILFVVMAQTRDMERNTQEFFYTTPVRPAAFLLGRFAAATLAALLISLLGIGGALLSSFMPWVAQERLLPFDWMPWLLVSLLLVLPNTLLFCSLFFTVAALTRSAALTFSAALGVLVYGVVLNTMVAGPGVELPDWVLLADPFGALPVSEASRFWTTAELNTLMPTAHLLPNRLLWLAVTACALAFTVARFRMELLPAPLRWFQRKPATTGSVVPVPLAVSAQPRFDGFSTWRQLRSQLRMDWRGVWQSPLFWILVLVTSVGIWSEARHIEGPLAGLSLYPVTALLLDFFRYSLLQNLLLAIVWFAALLIQRERDCRLDGITASLPCADWVPLLSKTGVLCAVVMLLYAVSLVVALAVQELAGLHDHKIGVFLQGIVVYHGFNAWMLCVLAVLIQVLSPSKWSGMVLTFAAFVTVLSLPSLGVEHLLLLFRIPAVIYSDMNGFGHFKTQTWLLVAYWSACCSVLLIAGFLLFARGAHLRWRDRLREAHLRLSAPLLRTSTAAAVVLVGAGGCIFYNTNVLNDYVTSDERFAAQAQYELDYGRWRDAPMPSVVDPDLRFDLYPAQRYWQSSGTVGLRNNKQEVISEFLLTVDKRNQVDNLQVEGATVVTADPAQGAYVVKPDQPLQPGATLTLRWSMRRENPGFVSGPVDNDIVENGSYVRQGLVPFAGYCTECELASNRERKRYGLPPAQGLPALGDPAHLDDLIPGIDMRSSFHAVISTDGDQTVVGAGQLQRSWEESGRRYFEYANAGPVWPLVVPLTARYTVARDRWHDIDLEIYHHAEHTWNIQAMMDAAKLGLDYYSREFAPYPHTYYRMGEYARYTTRVQAGIGSVAYAEASGFLTDLRGMTRYDYATLHELAHQWWGNDVYGAYMQGRQVLNEGLAQYSTFMAYKAAGEITFMREFIAGFHNSFLAGRKGDTLGENPVIKSDEGQAHIAYGKAAQVLFGLQELIGADKVNLALRRYHDRFVAMQPPLPTTLDLVQELREVAGPDYQQYITDQFEKLMLYDSGIEAVAVSQTTAGYAVTIDISAHQYEADPQGAETAVPLDTWFEVVVFPVSDEKLFAQQPLYQQFHRLHSGQQQVRITVPVPPGAVAVDPYHLMIDRKRENNTKAVAE
jgi:ABC-2 type transport system permease protein